MNAPILRFLGAISIVGVTLPTPADANAPAGRYVVTNGGTVNGTVYDTKTKLTWQQTVDHICLGRRQDILYKHGFGLAPSDDQGGTDNRRCFAGRPIDRSDSLSLDPCKLLLVFVFGGQLAILRVGRRLPLRLHARLRRVRLVQCSLCALRTGILALDLLTCG
jgi:hypothetical protein